MYWSLSLDVQTKTNSLKKLDEIRLKEKSKIYDIYNDISSKFSSDVMDRNLIGPDSEFIRLETCPISEEDDRKGLAAEIVSENFFDTRCKKDIENYFGGKK